MDKKQAQTLVSKTLESEFDKGKFTNLVKNLLNGIDESKAFHARGYVPEIFKNYIKSYERIGTYIDPDGKKVDILIVYLQRESSIERARTSQRNFAARYLKDRDMKDAGLMAFVSPDPKDWRFSFVKMEYKFEETAKGSVKVKEEFTPAKRYSFLVGTNENSHTAQSRLVPLLTKDESKPAMETVEDLFSVEKATKEFFDKYRDLYLRTHEKLEEIVSKDKALREDFESKGVNTVDFSKKLLGQIVFLYFLQRKGWFGVPLKKQWGEGDKKFLRTLFEWAKGEKKNYFNYYLEPLFYEALAKERTDDYYRLFDCRIPFLNGGLFDPINNYDWVNTVINFPNDLFSNNNKTKEGDVGDGILDIFDRFNFTVKEDEPLEKEVAVDPEMLGKVFENLLEVKDRKSKGTYYTPREIVHYMCVQSLVNYLSTELTNDCHSCEGRNPVPTKEDLEKLIKHGESVGENEAKVEQKGEETDTYYYKLPESIRDNAKLIDEKLADIKVCDPAIGSGAFPVGMMTEIVRVRNVLTSYLSKSCHSERSEESRSMYNFKRHCIHNSLYGVDIDLGAIEIAKLRLWLSLIVDEEDIKQIKPLPNLDYKIMQGNSLLEEYEGIKLFDDKFISGGSDDANSHLEHLTAQQQKLQNEYIQLHTSNKLTKMKQSELDAELKKVASLIKKVKKPEKKEENLGLFDVISKAKEKAEKLKQLHEAFFDAIHKKEKDSIKKEIEDLEWELIEATLQEQGKASELKKLNAFKKANAKPFFLWKLNFAEVFQEKGGFNIVIANPPYVKEYVNRSAFDGLRNSPYYQGKMDIWYLFACNGIDVLNKSGILTYIAQNNWVTSYGAKKMRDKVISDTSILQMLDFGDYKIFDTAGIQTMVMMFRKDSITAEYEFDYRRIQNKTVSFRDIQDLLNYNDNPIVEYLKPKINRNALKDQILTFSSSNIQVLIDKLLAKSDFNLYGREVAQGIVFPQDYVNKKSKEILGGEHSIGNGIFVLSNEEKRKLLLSKEELNIIKPLYTTRELFKWYGTPQNKEWVIYTDSKFKYSKNLKPYPHIKAHLDKFKKAITSDNKPYGLHRAREEDFFNGEKIISVRKCTEPTFTYTDYDCYVSATFYVIKTKRLNMKYLTALLNSKLLVFWLKHRGKMQGSNYQIDKEPLLALPLISVANGNQKALITIVDKIISKIKLNLDAGNKIFNQEISKYEQQIDQLVYKLYGLTDDEIKLVEQTCND